jgi:hypothetical protein
MMVSKVLLPEPDAPTIATVSLGIKVKSISRRMSRVPAASVTDLYKCETEIKAEDIA